MLTSIDDIFAVAKRKAQNTKKRIVLCNAANEHSLQAVIKACEMGIVCPILVGDETQIKEIAKKTSLDISTAEIIHCNTLEKTIEESVKAVHNHHADILMKGGITTPQIMKGVLNKEYGLRSSGMISHLAIFEIPEYHKLLTLTDAAMNIAPSLEDKAVIIQNTVDFLRKVGIETPKVAAVAAIEQINPKMPATVDADELKQMYLNGKIKNCIVDGPMSFDLSISMESKIEKGFHSDVAGDADVILAPDIEAANMLYKSFSFFGKARGGAVIIGAAAPIVLTSRADTMYTKLSSIALSVAGI
ncbi:MAG: bifunctional enoyl-CoA hydratase/phosphate acetyltransferase [Flavobacteriales bacterium]|nr:bifunctional enoyl-CoA hydratase/phosphate acetyltransferase [Flavobacteriales bacterium]